MNIDDAINDLCICSGPIPVGITYITEPDHHKEGNPFYVDMKWKIEKIADMNGFCGAVYQNSVNNQLAREGEITDFHSKPMWKGKGMHLNKFLIQHVDKGTKYLKILPKTVEDEEEVYKIKRKELFRFKTNGLPLNMEQLKKLVEFEVEKKLPENQGTKKPVFWRVIELKNIQQMRFNGKIYVR